MTTEELLKPRYIVTAEYPNSDYCKGDIIAPDYNEQFFLKYPHLFRKLQWFEEREEKDMPEYVKLIYNERIAYVHKVESWNGENFNGHPLYEYYNNAGTPMIASVEATDPATETEYLNFKNTKL